MEILRSIRFCFFAVTTFALTFYPAMGAAQQTSVEELQKKLEQRDRVIMELLRRVEALERRAGTSPESSADAGEQATMEAEALADAYQPEAETKAAARNARPAETAPGEVVVDEDAAERALERSLTQAGALLLRPGQIEVEPSLSYARNEDATPTFVNRGGRTFSAQRERNADSLTLDLSLRLGLPWDSQLELGMPYRWRRVESVTNVDFSPVGASGATGAGLGDIRVGAAKTLLREGLWRPDLVGRVTWHTGSGEVNDDGIFLGGGFHELHGSLTAIKRQDPVIFIGGLSYEHTFEEDNIQPGESVSSSFGGFIALSPETSLRLLFSGAYQKETEVSGSSVGGSDQVIGSFVVGGSTLLAPGVLIDLATGIGLTDDADDFSVTLSVPMSFDGARF